MLEVSSDMEVEGSASCGDSSLLEERCSVSSEDTSCARRFDSFLFPLALATPVFCATISLASPPAFPKKLEFRRLIGLGKAWRALSRRPAGNPKPVQAAYMWSWRRILAMSAGLASCVPWHS